MKRKAKLYTDGLTIKMDDKSPIQSIAEDIPVYDEERNLIGRVVKSTQQPDGSVTVAIQRLDEANILRQQAREIIFGSMETKKRASPETRP